MPWTIHRLQQMMCGLHGHDAVLHFERNRVSLQCLTCGLESPGWTIESQARCAQPVTDGKLRVLRNRRRPGTRSSKPVMRPAISPAASAPAA
jgi:hypothetical protein